MKFTLKSGIRHRFLSKSEIFLYFLTWQWRPSWIYARTLSQNKHVLAEMSLECQLQFEK